MLTPTLLGPGREPSRTGLLWGRPCRHACSQSSRCALNSPAAPRRPPGGLDDGSTCWSPCLAPTRSDCPQSSSGLKPTLLTAQRVPQTMPGSSLLPSRPLAGEPPVSPGHTPPDRVPQPPDRPPTRPGRPYKEPTPLASPSGPLSRLQQAEALRQGGGEDAVGAPKGGGETSRAHLKGRGPPGAPAMSPTQQPPGRTRALGCPFQEGG